MNQPAETGKSALDSLYATLGPWGTTGVLLALTAAAAFAFWYFRKTDKDPVHGVSFGDGAKVDTGGGSVIGQVHPGAVVTHGPIAAPITAVHDSPNAQVTVHQRDPLDRQTIELLQRQLGDNQETLARAETELRAAREALAARGPTDDRATAALKAMQTGDNSRAAALFAEVETGKAAAGRTALAEAATAAQYQGALALTRSVAAALAHYRKALEYVPHDDEALWWVGTLAQQTGDTALARRSFEALLTLSAPDSRKRSVALNGLGDMLLAVGDLAAARRAYADGLAIARRLTARDPDNTEWQRDLVVSHVKLGDVARQTGDIAAARTHWLEAQHINAALRARQPAHPGWQREGEALVELLRTLDGQP